MQVPIERVRPGMRIGLTAVVTKVEPVGPDEYLLETQRDGFQALGLPPSQRTYPRGYLISIEEDRR
ncbi:hypothetical protein ALMP_10250 [Streptomyces sp. A012304]|nr:hypothetical protein ALMP_10250 [Streptomyces sp. A012304]